MIGTVCEAVLVPYVDVGVAVTVMCVLLVTACENR